jgi:hypothetical protein
MRLSSQVVSKTNQFHYEIDTSELAKLYLSKEVGEEIEINER